MQGFKLLERCTLLGFAILLLSISSANADLQIFTDRASWQAAAGGGVGDQFENFNSFTVDTFYGAQHGPVSAGFLTLDLTDTGLNDTSWLIDVTPDNFDSLPNVNGTPYATTIGYQGGHTQADTLLSFGPVQALGFDYKDGSYGDSNGILTTSLGDTVSLQNENSTETFFLGLLYTEGEIFSSLLWAPVGGIGYGISIDNVEAFSSVSPVPDPPALGPLEDYDNFNAKIYNGCKYCINSEKWRGLEKGDYNTESLRAIKSKKARLSLRSWGRMDVDMDRERGRNRLIFRDSANFAGVCFTPRIKKYEIKNCTANPDFGSVMIRYSGNFYDTGANDDGDAGVVYAGFNFQRDGDFPAKKGMVYISAWAEECKDVDCEEDEWSTYDGIDDPDLYFGTTKASKNKKALCIAYDPVEHELVFSYGNDVRTVNAGHGLPPMVSDLTNSQTWHVIGAQTDVENCTAGPITGFVDGDVDNVTIREYQ